jgi:hypothetical protein
LSELNSARSISVFVDAPKVESAFWYPVDGAGLAFINVFGSGGIKYVSIEVLQLLTRVVIEDDGEHDIVNILQNIFIALINAVL